MKNERIIDRFDKYMNIKGLNDNKVTIQLGFSTGLLGKSRKEGRDLSKGVVDSILNFYTDIDKVWFLTGDGDMLKNKGEKVVTGTVPYYPEINASAGLDFLSDNGRNYSLPISIPNVDAEAYINVFGDSMYPKYCSGQIIGIKEVSKDLVMHGHAYVVQMVDGEAYLKYINGGSDGDHWLLVSENPAYKPQEFHLSKIRKVYIIKSVISKTTIF